MLILGRRQGGRDGDWGAGRLCPSRRSPGGQTEGHPNRNQNFIALRGRVPYNKDKDLGQSILLKTVAQCGIKVKAVLFME